MVSIRSLALLFNSLSGFLAVAVIVIIATDLPEASDEKKLFSYGYLVLGAATILVCLVGFVGALKGHICTTWVYAISQLVLLIAMIALITVFKMQHEKKTPPLEILKKAFEDYKNDKKEDMEKIHKKYECCGVYSSEDYKGMQYPNSCIGHIGCLEKMKAESEEEQEAPQLIGWALMVVQMASFVFSTILGVKLNNKARRAQY